MQPDVVIIGGGPAGCAAALALLNRGHSVVVIASAARGQGQPKPRCPR